VKFWPVSCWVIAIVVALVFIKIAFSNPSLDTRIVCHKLVLMVMLMLVNSRNTTLQNISC